MRTLLAVSVVLTLSGVGIGCGGDDEADLPDVDCSGTIPKYAEVTAIAKCKACHDSAKTGASRNGADTDVNFDTEAAAMKSSMKGAEEVYGGDMPPAGSGVTLTQAEKDQLYKWALCTN